MKSIAIVLSLLALSGCVSPAVRVARQNRKACIAWANNKKGLSTEDKTFVLSGCELVYQIRMLSR